MATIYQQRHYVALADLAGRLAVRNDDPTLIECLALHCEQNADLDRNGNRNIKMDRFLAAAVKSYRNWGGTGVVLFQGHEVKS